MKHSALLAGITLSCIAVVFSISIYGPMKRSFAPRPTLLSVGSSDEVAHAWKRHGVKGRTLICFTRYLNAVETKESQGMKATEISMAQGIIRRVFHIPPDTSWPEIQQALAKRNDMRQTSEGFIGIFDYGRVYIQPLSRFSDVGEKALFVVEPKVWTSDELMIIAGLLKSGRISSDLAIVIRGSEKDTELFRRALQQ